MNYLKKEYLSLLLLIGLIGCVPNNQPKKESAPPPDSINSYEALNSSILQGWNTWDNRDIMSHVLLPAGITLQLAIVDTVQPKTLNFAFTGNRVAGSEVVRPIAHTADGSYTAFQIIWRGFNYVIASVSKGEQLDVIISPKRMDAKHPGHITGEISFPYGMRQELRVSEEGFELMSTSPLSIRPLGKSRVIGNKISIASNDIGGFTTTNSTLTEVQQRLALAEEAYWRKKQAYGNMAQAYDVIQNALNWMLVYDPVENRAVSPVARPWSYGWGARQAGGYVQFCWDNFFAAYMHAVERKELAYNEAFQMLKLIDELGFVPNYAGPGKVYSRDRSQPPVGSMMIKQIYKMHPNTWFLEESFDRLLQWNRWWAAHRDVNGYLAWGSTPFDNIIDDKQRTQNNHAAASNESGLDNTPMYDGVPFDTVGHVLLQADVGLMGLYIGDCDALIEMAEILDKREERDELIARRDRYTEKLKSLWNDEFGLFLNKRTDTGEWSYRISPTNFYPLIAKVATQQQAERMIEEHFYNPDEFWGEYIMPSIARNDTGYTGRDYWRGSIWAPMNFLVYLGIRNYDLPKARKDLADKSLKLQMKNWEEHGLVLENYHAEHGGYPGYRSEYFYHWGALLSMINLIEHGHVPPTETLIR